MAKLKDFTRGILKENPVLVIMIGLCPLLAVSTNAYDALGMGIAATFVLVMSNTVVSLTRKLIPTQIRIPIFIIIISTFVTIIDYLMKAYAPELNKSLGIFVPLIVVNCMILGGAEGFAYKNTLFSSILNGLGTGIGFILAITLLGSIREILGNGTIFGYELLGPSFEPAIIMILPPGAFLVIGFMMAISKRLQKGKS